MIIKYFGTDLTIIPACSIVRAFQNRHYYLGLMLHYSSIHQYPVSVYIYTGLCHYLAIVHHYYIILLEFQYRNSIMLLEFMICLNSYCIHPIHITSEFMLCQIYFFIPTHIKSEFMQLQIHIKSDITFSVNSCELQIYVKSEFTKSLN